MADTKLRAMPGLAHLNRPRHLLRGAIAAGLLTALLAGCSGDDAKPEQAASSEAQQAAVSALLDQGVSALTRGDIEAATTAFEQALELDDQQVVAQYNLGLIAQQQGNEAAAAARYDAALKIDGNYGPALFNRAILWETKDLDKAISLYRKAITAQPDHAPAYMRLGFALVHQGKNDEAAPFLEKGVKLDPEMTKVEAPSYQ